MLTRRGFLERASLAAAALAGGCVNAKAEGEALVIAQCGDPQIGFGTPQDNDYAGDLARAKKEIELINSLKPDLAVFQGDMAHKIGSFDQEWPALLKTLKCPVVVTPGNHDMANSLVGDNADRFRKVFGHEYWSFDLKGWRFIAGNSQYWFPTKEQDRQRKYERWVRQELDRAAAERCKTILATHVPPFVKDVNEKNAYYNHPRKGRVERLERYLKAGARFYLAGHTHRMHQNVYKGLTILNPETTCRNFDSRPFGFRLLTIRPDATFDWKFVPVIP